MPSAVGPQRLTRHGRTQTDRQEGVGRSGEGGDRHTRLAIFVEDELQRPLGGIRLLVQLVQVEHLVEQVEEVEPRWNPGGRW